MKMRLAALLAFCALLAACGLLRGLESREPAPWVQAGSPRPASDVESLLLYFQYIKKLTATDLGREHDTARQAYSRTRSDFNRVRLALLLVLPNAAFNDDTRALELLEPVAKNQSGQFSGLATLLASHLQERRRLDASAQGLQQKLDALKSLERSMIERQR